MYLTFSVHFLLAESGALSLWTLLKALIYALVEGVTEWLPVSSTGHLILLEKFLPLPFSAEFRELFLVLVQLAAIGAVIFLFWSKLWPFQLRRAHSGQRQVAPLGDRATTSSARRGGGDFVKWEVMELWLKILVASLPAGIVGVLFSDWIFEHLYGPVTVAIMLILVGIALYLVDSRRPRVRHHRAAEISYALALMIGLAQLVAAVLPGTSRSGICILAGLLLGLSRPLAAEFSFFMAIPAMAGASLLELLKLRYAPTTDELIFLLLTSVATFLVSMLVIDKLMKYIQRRSFRPFAIYRIALALLVLLSLPLGA